MDFITIDKALIERQASVAVATVVVALIGYIYGRLLTRLVGDHSAWFSIFQIAAVGVSREYVEILLRKLGYSETTIAASMPIYVIATLFGQPDVFSRFGSLITAV